MRRGENILLPKEPETRRSVRIQRIAARLADVPLDEVWQLILQPFRHQRTNQQNRYLRGVCTKMLSEHLGYEEQEMHDLLCGLHFGWVEKKVPPTPNNPRGVKDIPARTTTANEDGEREVLDKRDFWDYVEFVQRFGAENNCVIPDPDPNYWRREIWRERAA